MADSGDLNYYLSGGVGNTDPALSIGGVESTTKVGGQSLAWEAGAMAGITLVEGFAIPDAGLWLEFVLLNGDLHVYDVGGVGVTWQEPLASGTVTINPPLTRSGIRLTIDVGLAGAVEKKKVLPSGGGENLFDDISRTESLNGMTDYRCIYVRNDHVSVPITVQAYLSVAGSSPAGLLIALDAAGLGGTAVTPADENTAPAGAVFSAPTVLADALQFTVGAGQSYPFWFKRNLNPFNLVTASNVMETVLFRLVL